MSDSYKNYSTNLEKIDIRKRREEHREWKLAQAAAEKREWEEWKRQEKLRAYLHDKGELDD